MCMMLEMAYFRAELVQLIVSRSDSELGVQRYGMKKNTVTVDPIMLQDELWMKQCENPSLKRRSRFLKTEPVEPRKLSFQFLNFEVSSVFRKPISEIFIRFRTPLTVIWQHLAERKMLDNWKYSVVFKGKGPHAITEQLSYWSMQWKVTDHASERRITEKVWVDDKNLDSGQEKEQTTQSSHMAEADVQE